MAYKTILPFDTASAFSPGAYTGYNPLSFSLGDYVNAPALSPVSTLTNYSPNSFIGDLSGFGSTATPGFMESPFMKNMLGYKAADGTQHMGWGGLALGAANGLMQGYFGLQNLKHANETLAFQKDSFAKNWGAQRDLTNAQLEAQFAARAASREGASSNPYGTVQENMQKYKVA